MVVSVRSELSTIFRQQGRHAAMQQAHRFATAKLPRRQKSDQRQQRAHQHIGQQGRRNDWPNKRHRERREEAVSGIQ